ncbi:MAG TPA: hypothetical protein VN936_00010, partial [Candidatus Acidoferrum sp.]|nr:hypothetical protein [Candidatus Acidoferrum sp.]
LSAGHVRDAAAIESTRTGVALSLSAERAARGQRFLAQARFDGLVTHLFAIRALLPDAIGSANCPTLPAVRDALREELDRLFIKLRLPNYALAERDVETPSLRAAVKRLAYDAAIASGSPPDPPQDALTLRGSFDSAELDDVAERVEAAPLASAAPWALLARLLPNRDENAARYRALLMRRLDEASSLEPADFLQMLQHRADPELDAALDSVLRQLSAA